MINVPLVLDRMPELEMKYVRQYEWLMSSYVVQADHE